MKTNRVKILITAFVILGFILVYIFYPGKKDSASDKNVAVVPSDSTIFNMSAADSEIQEIINILRDLKSAEIDTGFFETKTFKTMIDNSVELAPEPAGRLNPFAPL